MNRSLFALLATCCALTAQKVAMTDGSERHVSVVGVTDLVLADSQSPAATEQRFASTLVPRLQDIVRFVRTFAPAITEPSADVQTLGDRHLVALGKPEQVAAVERVVVHAREHKELGFHLDLRVLTVPAAVFDRELADTLTPAPVAAANGERAPRVALLDDERTRRLVKTLRDSKQVEILQSPNLTTPSLVLALIRVGKERRYVRDFAVDVATAAFDLKPVHDTVFDGLDAKVLCAAIGKDTIGVLLDLVDQKVEQPIAEHTTTVPGTTQQVTVQTPHVTGCRGSQAVEMKSGETAIMAARKPDGGWLVSFLTVTALRPTPQLFPVRR